MIIPYKELSAETMQALIEDFVTRDGTDYGREEMSLREKSDYLLTLLEKGELLISYDTDMKTCGLVTKEELKNRL